MSEGYGYQQPGYGQPGAPPSGETSPPVDGGYAAPEPAAHGKKKKRGYAAEAFDIGVGANTVPAAGVPPAQFGAAQPSYGYQQPAQATPAYGQPGPTAAYGAAPAYGLPTGPAAGAAYNPPTPGYGGAGVDGLTAGMSQMNMGGAPAGQPAAIPQAQAQTTQLNQLYPIDVQQPVRPEIIDFPPPPIILPAGISVTQSATSNCPHKYTRSTLNAVPATNKLLSKSKLPFALVIQPYGSLHDQSDPVPLVEDQTIARCRRCRTYINPFVTFMDQGHRWRCNMCNLTNDVPQAFDWDAASQKSVDRWKRHELNHAVMEFVAPQEYMVRPPQPLVYLFLIDVSYAAVASGLVATAAETIFASLDSIPNADQCTRLGFIAVDSSLHYFSIPTDHDAAEKDLDTKMMVVSDLDEPFMPVPDNLLAHLSTSRNSIEKFLNALPRMFQHNQNNGSCMGSAVVAGHKLISSLGGKLTVLTASLPSIGQGKLEMREDRKVFGTSKETGLLQTANNFYKSFAVECSKSQVCVDMFLFSSQYQDVASLSNLPRYTGGQTWYYPSWSAQRELDALKFKSEFSKYLSSEIALEAVLRVRATTGLRMNAFYGNFFNRSSDLCAFPSMPRDQCYVIEVAIDEPVNKPVVFLQAAVLHTTCNGERRIRIITVALPTTHNLADVYASADQVAITTYFAHKAVERVLSGGLDAARDALQSKLIELLQTYRKELSGASLNVGMQFPANLHALPLLFLGLIKHVGLRKSTMIPTDMRSAALCLLSTLPPPLLMRYIHPKMYDLTRMPEGAGEHDPATGQIQMPPEVPKLSVSSLNEQGLFLIDDGQIQFLWVGQHLPPDWLEAIFGVQDRNFLPVGNSVIPTLENELNERIRNVIDKSRDYLSVGVGSIIKPSLYVVRPEAKDGAPLTLWARTLLVEDPAEQAPSIEQFIATLRSKVVT